MLFITGMVESGKSTISNKIAKEKNATILALDWLTWSEVYKDNKFAMIILNDFYNICPKAKIAAQNNFWHREMLSKSEQLELKKQYSNFLIRYTIDNPNKLYIIEGIDIYNKINIHIFPYLNIFFIDTYKIFWHDNI